MKKYTLIYIQIHVFLYKKIEGKSKPPKIYYYREREARVGTGMITRLF